MNSWKQLTVCLHMCPASALSCLEVSVVQCLYKLVEPHTHQQHNVSIKYNETAFIGDDINWYLSEKSLKFLIADAKHHQFRISWIFRMASLWPSVDVRLKFINVSSVTAIHLHSDVKKIQTFSLLHVIFTFYINFSEKKTIVSICFYERLNYYFFLNHSMSRFVSTDTEDITIVFIDLFVHCFFRVS